MCNLRHPKEFKTPVRISESCCFASELEQNGPIGKYLDGSLRDCPDKDESWEKHESRRINQTVKRLLEKSGKNDN